MKMDITPKTLLGKWSVGLNAFFLIVIAVSVILVKVIKILSFDDHWWDVTAVVFIVPVITFFTGIISVIKNKDHSVSVFLSIFVSICVILFILLHSLFISD
jgi:ABC-type multidrug transport system permease subunit